MTSRQKKNMENGIRNTADHNSAMPIILSDFQLASELRVSSQAPCGGPIFFGRQEHPGIFYIS